MNRIIRFSIVMFCIVCMTGCVKEETQKEIVGSGTAEPMPKATPSAEDAESLQTSTEILDYKKFFYEQKMKENSSPDTDLQVHEVQDFADGKLIYAEWIGEGPHFDISYAVKQASGEWEIIEAGGHEPAGSPGMVLAAGMCQGKMIVSVVVEEEHWNQDSDIREKWNPDHIQLFFADGSSQNVQIQAKGRKILVLDEKKKITDWKLYTKKEELYSYALAKKWNRTPVENLDFIETEEP